MNLTTIKQYWDAFTDLLDSWPRTTKEKIYKSLAMTVAAMFILAAIAAMICIVFWVCFMLFSDVIAIISALGIIVCILIGFGSVFLD